MFKGAIHLHSVYSDGEYTLSELLPHAFGPANLGIV